MSSENIPEWKKKLMEKRAANATAQRGIATGMSPSTMVSKPKEKVENTMMNASNNVAKTTVDEPIIQNVSDQSNFSTITGTTRPIMGTLMGGTSLRETHSSNDAINSLSNSENIGNGMEGLITMVNKLQDAFATIGLTSVDLPQIAVIGCQSAGKSSVLENIVGRDFLPRGAGICTRRPLILQLIRDTTALQEYGIFLHTDQKFYDFEAIKQEIVRETDRVTGNSKNVSPIPINLKIYSPHVLNLTLVDLPGLTKVPVAGQSKEAVTQIKDMVMNIARRANTILLAVTPATGDLANSDSLEAARDVDPQSKRTISVMTKLDLMDDGTDALDILEGRVYKNMTFVGVVNRSQRDIESNRDIRSALSAEKDYFDTHPVYHRVAHRMGTQFLAQKLNIMLINHIKNTLPEIRRTVATRLTEAERELGALGTDDSEMGRRQLAFGMLQNFSKLYISILDGADADELDRVADGPHKFEDNILAGAIIKKLLTKTLTQEIQLADITMQLSDEAILRYIQNASGAQDRFSVPQEAFTAPIKVGISQLINPCLDIVDSVAKELLKLVKNTSSRIKELEIFPQLETRLSSVATMMIEDHIAPTRKFVKDLVEMELAYIQLGTLRKQKNNVEVSKGLLLEGFILKKSGGKWGLRFGKKTSSYERRWFVLKSQTLFYFDNPESTTPLGVLPLEGLNLRTAAEVATQDMVIPDTNNWDEMRLAAYKAEREKLQSEAVETFGEHYIHLSHPNGRTILHDREFLEIRCETPEDYVIWLEALKTATRGEDKQEENDIELVRRVVTQYIHNCMASLVTQIPKAVMLNLVNPVKQLMERNLMAQIYDEKLISEILAEDPAVKERRQQIRESVKLLREVSETLKEFQKDMK
eukprot:TRINITY_DN2511_c0_g1_i1.p1 TRINITY_DN2511_c0_g1~~TRINITY_DN2511_c0_g1_i1.p1  ORF type:complete len:882 (+),score=247.68 TRINITY_DN2511_c0_g1_i1:29-2647(+)